MASVNQSAGVNGNHAAHQQYGEQSYNHNSAASGDYAAAAAPSNAAGAGGADGSGSNGQAEIPKDEVSWFFVEQYYTILSKNPDRLYLFYNKRSQFVSGNEAEKVMTCVGQKAINERIKELDIQDAKVRVTNVDSQGSGQCIVIQVIGEISNKSQPQRKFVQTFVLAEQTNGYFVLNDIFRYIDEEEEAELEASQEPQQEQEQEQQPQQLSQEQDQQQQLAASGYQESQPPAALPEDGNASALEQAAAAVDSKLEQSDPAAPNGGAVADDQLAHAQEAPAAAPLSADEVKVEPEQAAEAVAQESTAELEKPREPEPTPAVSPPKKAAEPVKPAAPKTWAGLVASNRVALPAAPASSTQPAAAAPASGAAAQPKAPRVAVQTAIPAVAAATAGPAASQEPEQPGTPASSGSEWQTTTRDHGKKQARVQQQQQQQQQAAPAAEGEKHRGYIKNVGETVDGDALRSALAKVAQVTYFDINRAKNCAFVDFSSPAGCQAAIAANPHVINGENIYVEERRMKNPNFAGPGRGGFVNRGRGDGRPQGQGRGGFNRDGGARGGFTPRGRGGPGVRGARGGAPVA